MLLLTLGATLISLPLYAASTGFERFVVPGAANIAVGVWYPSSDAAPDEANTPFRQALALDGAIAGDELPLIIISHGNGGWMGGHASTALALAQNGYVVVALQHAGDNSEDESAAPSQWIVTRPAEIVAVLDFLMNNWRGADRLDGQKIGLFGFSAGGYTALVAAGGKPDFARGSRHCVAHPNEFVCRIGAIREIGDGPDANVFASTPMIGAVSVAAPGFGFVFSAEGLSDLDMPVQIWSGADDDRVPHETNGAYLASHLTNVRDINIVEDAGHFAFLNECNPQLQDANPRIWAMVCVDAEGFNRGRFHDAFNAAIVEFYDTTLER